MSKKSKTTSVDRRLISSPKHVAIVNGHPVRITKQHRKAIRTHNSNKFSAPEFIKAISSGHNKVMNFIKRGILIQTKQQIALFA